MRTVQDDAAVRLYHLDEEGGIATTLAYGTLGEALRLAAEQPAELQTGLFLQTSGDVVAYLELIDG